MKTSGFNFEKRKHHRNKDPLRDWRLRTGRDPPAQICRNFQNVGSNSANPCREIHSRRAGPGIGDSSIPTDGIGMKRAAIQMHDLVRSLGIEKARIVGHDIGLMLAYAYATLFPSETEKLVVMDAFLPGVQGWEPIYNSPNYWHFRFNGPTAEPLVRGRESIYFAYFWDGLAADKNRSIPKADRKAYIAAYSRPRRMRASWEYFVSWPQAA